MKKNIGISVIIPTYNYQHILQKTLDSLVDQSLDKNRYEVIVVDDGSSDNTRNFVETYQANIALRYFFQEDSGFQVAKARNVGITHATFNRILFLDSGMVAAPDLLVQHYQWAQNDNQVVLVGLSYGVYEFSDDNHQLILDIFSQNDLATTFSIMKKCLTLYDCRYHYLESIKFDSSKLTIPWILCWTGQLSCSTEILSQIGGFDEWFNSWGGEDVELGLRLFKIGCQFHFLAEMYALHYPHNKDPESKQLSAKANIEYIHDKHNLPATKLMKEHNWQEIVIEQSF
ncbi:glycosyltransferase [Paraglaciecola sp.]|uniref:glycosyltransferase n=1 Tax=Paraglaciecola sp. TaxID=1920173 RepID=UPI0030F3FE51